jgi:DNA-directed RNA polymerase specialized sigma subunit
MAKDYFITVDGEKISVSEEVYRAFKRPLWSERKRRKVRAERERSLEACMNNGLDVSSDERLIHEIVEYKRQIEILLSVLDELAEAERGLIDALFFEEKSERDYARQIGVAQTTLNYRKNKILKWLKERLL